MAVNVNTRVASPVRGGASAADLFKQMTQSSPSLVPDPRADVMATVGAIPTQQPDPNVPRGIPMLESQSTIETQQDIADIGGAPYPPQADVRPVLDEDGLPVIDPATGQKQYEPIGMGDYNQQFQTEQASHFGVKQAVHEMATGDPFEAQRTLFQAEQDAAGTGWGLTSREEKKLDTKSATLDGYIQQSATDLEQVIMDADSAIFGGESGTASQAMIEVDGGNIPVGYKVMADAGYSDSETRGTLNTLVALSLNQALTQAGVNKEPGRDIPEGIEPGGGKDYQSNMINATRHALVNGLNKMGIKLGDGGADLMAKAAVMHNIYNGNLIPSKDKTGKVILEASPDTKRQAMNLQRISEAVTNDVKRKGASSVPTNAGASFSRGKPQLTKGSLAAEDATETKVADLVKGILGAVGQVYRRKDVARKQMELSWVFDPNFVHTIDGQFAWSTHPMAKRNNLHEGAFLAAKAKVRRPDHFNASNPLHEKAFAQMQQEGALRVMQEMKALAEFDMKNIEKSKGLLYSHWIHGSNNQRFYPNSYNTDYMGSKNIIRDTMALADQDSVRALDLFNVQAVEIMKRKAKSVLSGNGLAVQKQLEELSPNQLGAIGAMRNAVMYYYTALEPSQMKNVAKMPVHEVIQLYTPEIGNRLAALGEKYNAVIANPGIEGDSEMMALWAATDKGEALGSLNLWDDFFRAKSLAGNPVTAAHSFALTHHAFSDGNQNGIFLQSLFFGLRDSKSSADALLRLAVARPSMDDMRVFGMDSMVHNLKDMLNDSPEKVSAWASFWAEAIKSYGRDTVAKDFFKKPLMQNAYGKDASMFGDVLMELLETNEDYSKLVDKYLVGPNGPYRDSVEAGGDLTGAVEGSLRKLIDSQSVNMMKNIGRFMAVVNQPIKIRGISGDMLTITPVGATPVNKSVMGSGTLIERETHSGEKTLLKQPSYLSDTLINPQTGESTELPSFAVQANPNASRGVQKFWNRKTQQYDEFNNALGTMQARQFAVLMIQALDGDLVKFTALEANKKRLTGNDKRNPWPVLFVHDSIIGTAGSSLLYDHVYNNVAIPAAIPQMKEIGRRIQEMVHKTESKEKADVERRGQPVGIGALGDYPSLGAVFDDIFERTLEKGKPSDYAPGSMTMPNDFKAVFLRRERAAQRAAKAKTSVPGAKQFDKLVSQQEATFGPSPEEKWEKYRSNLLSILASARKHGWVRPGDMTPREREMQAIQAKDFAPLVDLAGEYLKMDRMKPWTDEFARRIDTAWDRLTQSTRRAGNVILQMGAGGGKPASKKGYNPQPIMKEADPKVVNTKINPDSVPALENVFDEEAPF